MLPAGAAMLEAPVWENESGLRPWTGVGGLWEVLGLSLTSASVICACSGLLVPWVGVLSSVSHRKTDAIRASEASSELAATRRWLLVSCLVVTLS